MEWNFFSRGVLIGLGIAIPVGPIGLLCFQRALNRGWLHGFASGLGAATADAAYGTVAALGLVVVLDTLAGSAFWLKLLGGLFLLWLGWGTLRAAPARQAASAQAAGLSGAYASVFVLTLFNPMTALSFLAIFSAIGIEGGRAASPLVLVAGVFFGSALWWAVLATFAVSLKRRFNEAQMVWINRLSGAVILGFGLWVLLEL